VKMIVKRNLIGHGMFWVILISLGDKVVILNNT